MADDSTIRAILTGYAGLTSLVGTRIYDQVAPVNTANPAPRPFIVLSTPSEVPGNFVSGAPNTAEWRIQFDIYGDTKASVRAVLAQVRAALYAAGHTGSEQLSQDLPADDPALRRITSDWLFVLSR